MSDVYYEVEMVDMGFCGPDYDTSSSTADETKWKDPDNCDFHCVFVTERNDETGEVEPIHEFDIPKGHKLAARHLLETFEDMIEIAKAMGVKFGSMTPVLIEPEYEGVHMPPETFLGGSRE